jgi:hypothetical protein
MAASAQAVPSTQCAAPLPLASRRRASVASRRGGSGAARGSRAVVRASVLRERTIDQQRAVDRLEAVLPLAGGVGPGAAPSRTPLMVRRLNP